MMHSRVNPQGDPPLAFGSVGWSDDGGTFYELGTDGDDGSILVRVTLFRGRDPTLPLDHSVAQGQKILAKLASNFVQIPPRTTRVLVAGPDGAWNVPGGPMIISADNANPSLIGNLKDGEAAVAAASSQGRVLIKKANDCVVLYTVDGNGKSVMAYVGADKIQLANAFGAITIDSSGVSLTSGQAALELTALGEAKLTGLKAAVSGSIASVAGQVMTMLGPGATPVTGVGYGPPGPGPVVLSSATVFVSP